VTTEWVTVTAVRRSTAAVGWLGRRAAASMVVAGFSFFV